MSKLDTLEPEFRTKIEILIDQVSLTTGMEWVCTSGRRTMAEQRKLFSQGRDNNLPKVTNAPAGSSPHNYGLAADLWPMKNGDIWWSAPPLQFKVLADLAIQAGLVPGYCWKNFQDCPHVEDDSWRGQRKLWQAGKLEVA
jgi:hypothetical protein